MKAASDSAFITNSVKSGLLLNTGPFSGKENPLPGAFCGYVLCSSLCMFQTGQNFYFGGLVTLFSE